MPDHGHRKAHTHCHEGRENHEHGHSHTHSHGDVNDYLRAVAEYKKTFASKGQVIEQTPDPAVREMLLHMQELGIETTFDRFDAQKPHCSFGLAGICCKNCSMGPCKVTPKAPRGACGADADVIVARNILRMVAAGTAAHGARGRENILALKYAAESKIDIPIQGEQKVRAVAKAYGIKTEGKSIEQLAGKIAAILLEDLSRTIPGKHKTLHSFAAKERIETWKKLDILPVGSYHEVFECLHRTGTGTDSDWKNIMKQFLRTGLAFAWTSTLASSIAMDSLYGLPERNISKVNLGAIKHGYVNIAVHGHSPLLVSQIVHAGRSEELISLARERGAKGIQFYGICCSGLSAMYRYGGVIPLANAVGAELVLGTGALDLWVADVQDVFPSIMEVAKCFKTTVVTTSDSNRLPGSEFYGLDHDHSNIDQVGELARKIVLRAIDSFDERREIPVKIPRYEVESEMGFSVENIDQTFGGLETVVQALKDGKILGIVNLVGCSNPRIVYEKAVVEITHKLLQNNILVLTNGCASFPLLKLGYCSQKALDFTGGALRNFLTEYSTPPVLHMGECLDNARASALFAGLSAKLGIPIKDMPYGFISPEWSNEKGVCAALAFRLLGVNSYHCVHTPMQGSDHVSEFMTTGTKPLLGSEMVVNVDHNALGDRIIADIKSARADLGWK